MTEKYDVKGMSCAACSSAVEKAVSSLEGVEKCTVNLLTNSMTVEGSASCERIISAVRKAGYDASPKDGTNKSDKQAPQNESEKTSLVRRLVLSLLLLLPLMYISMGHNMFSFPVPGFLSENHVAMGILQMLLCICVLQINRRFFISGIRAVLRRVPNMDTLVALGSGASFLYSTFVLFAMSETQRISDAMSTKAYLGELYFESAAMILVLITVGKTLEARSKGKTTDAIRKLMELKPKTACVVRNGEEITVNAGDVAIGETFIVRPGEGIPVDGVIKEGDASIDESSLTGESIPADKKTGDPVYSATVNKSGYIVCEATGVGEDTALSKIIKMVSDASAGKAPIAALADKVSGVFVPTVIAISAVTLAVWLILGENVGFSLARAISVLVISCPCALGLATPVAIMVGNGVGARNKILYKTATALEETGKAKVVVLDKTGTVTKGEPDVTDVIPFDGYSESELVSLAYSAERMSIHPLASAVVKHAQSRGLSYYEADSFELIPGGGISAGINGKTVYAVNLSHAEGICPISERERELVLRLSSEGKTPVIIVENGNAVGIIAIADTVREDSRRAVERIRKMGIRVVMLTGDNKRCAAAIAEKSGIREYIAEVLPDEKEKEVRKLQKEGHVIMVGDGINDAPALASADVGIAIGAGTDIAIDSADVVLMNSSLSDVETAIRLSRRTLKNIKENLFWAFFYNAVGIPLAAGVFIRVLGWKLSPMFGAAAMSLSSICVVTNALRINLFKPNENEEKDSFIKRKEKTMKKTIMIEGMMCPHCEARVKKTLDALKGVENSEVSHEKGSAVLTLSEEVSNDVLRKSVEDEGYKVTSIE